MLIRALTPALIPARVGGNVRPVSDSQHPSPRDGASGHVLVFDSGVGGLSVLREITALLPAARLTYAADNAAFPYGVKTEGALIARVSAVIAALVDRVAPDIVVIACNTASTTALDAVRRQLAIPVIGVVPAIKPAAAASRTGAIGLLGTATTVATRYTETLIRDFAGDRVVLTCGATELVEAAERKMQALPVDLAAIARVLDRLFGQDGGDRLDVVVLGCTHFPLLKPELAQAAPHPVVWMDSGAAIARRVAALLGENRRGGSEAAGRDAMGGAALFTARTGAVERMRPALASYGLTEIGFLSPVAA
jgi:glutamate racemase